jgi:hypothetical protein
MSQLPFLPRYCMVDVVAASEERQKVALDLQNVCYHLFSICNAWNLNCNTILIEYGIHEVEHKKYIISKLAPYT